MKQKDWTTYTKISGEVIAKVCLRVNSDVFARIKNTATGHGWSLTVVLDLLIRYMFDHMEEFEDEILELSLENPPVFDDKKPKTLYVNQDLKDRLIEYAKDHDQKNNVAFHRAFIFGLAHLDDLLSDYNKSKSKKGS